MVGTLSIISFKWMSQDLIDVPMLVKVLAYYSIPGGTQW